MPPAPRLFQCTPPTTSRRRRRRAPRLNHGSQRLARRALFVGFLSCLLRVVSCRQERRCAVAPITFHAAPVCLSQCGKKLSHTPTLSIALGATPPGYGEPSYYHLRADSAPRSSPATCSASQLALPAPHLVPGRRACVATIKTAPIIKSIRIPVPPAPHHVSCLCSLLQSARCVDVLQPSPARKPATPRCHSTPGTIAVGGCIVSPPARAATTCKGVRTNWRR